MSKVHVKTVGKKNQSFDQEWESEFELVEGEPVEVLVTPNPDEAYSFHVLRGEVMTIVVDEEAS
jgi:hypothetical protein